MKNQFTHPFLSLLMVALTWSTPMQARSTSDTSRTRVSEHAPPGNDTMGGDAFENRDPIRKEAEMRTGTVPDRPEAPAIATGQKPGDLLVLILLGALLGMTGQGIRAVIGLKKNNDAESQPVPGGPAGTANESQFRPAQLGFSLFLSLVVGALAGILAAVGMDSPPEASGQLAATFISAGYAGTDFIEGFMKRSGAQNVGQRSLNALGSAKVL